MSSTDNIPGRAGPQAAAPIPEAAEPVPQAAEPVPEAAEPIQEAAATVAQNQTQQIAGARLGQVALFTCPECGGTLWQVDNPDVVQFRCHVGHVLSGLTLLQLQAQQVEDSLWRAVRTLTDQSVLARQLAEAGRRRGGEDADALEAQARAAQDASDAVRRLVEAP